MANENEHNDKTPVNRLLIAYEKAYGPEVGQKMYNELMEKVSQTVATPENQAPVQETPAPVQEKLAPTQDVETPEVVQNDVEAKEGSIVEEPVLETQYPLRKLLLKKFRQIIHNKIKQKKRERRYLVSLQSC